MEHNINEISVDNHRTVSKGQSTLECVIDTSASGSVTRLLSITTDARVKSIETAETVKVSGELNVKVICVDVNGMINSYDYVSEFAEPMECGIENAENLSANVIILDVDSAINSGKITVQAIVEIALTNEKTTSYQALSVNDSTAITKLDDVCFTKSRECVDKDVIVIEEYDCGVNVDKVLLFDSCAIVTNSKISDGILTVNGEVAATIIYESEGIITTKQLNLPYQEEFSMKSECGKACLKACVKDSKIVLQGSGDDNSMKIEVTVNVSGTIYAEMTESVICDVCSTTNKLTCEYSDIELTRYNGCLCLKDKISGSAEISGEYESIRRIVASDIARNCITNTYTASGMITIEGVLTANVIYEDNNTDIHSVQIELPYSLPFDSDKICDGDAVEANALVEILNTKVKRDREIEVTALISLQTNIFSSMKFRIVSNMELGEPITEKQACLTVYQPGKNDDLWTIAKNMLAPIDEILRQNPHLKDGVGNGKILYYRQRV